MIKNGEIITKGTRLMIWKNGRNCGWHTFTKDVKFTLIIDRRTYQGLYKVSDKSDNGTYIPKGN